MVFSSIGVSIFVGLSSTSYSIIDSIILSFGRVILDFV
jgi:hypothetical protein